MHARQCATRAWFSVDVWSNILEPGHDVKAQLAVQEVAAMCGQ